ncbi:general stress protein CTC [bacterium BMS3Abin10]|nr:general stress protein CTC [bacterium BMS3Abin10]GBE40058.1 general stress protein CTC [bacterium BMS3Bbin08]HDH51436.1 50S ribosomal protein L25 [Nitrospirota bacterium]
MEKVSLTAEKRTEIGKGGARSLRRDGFLPAVLYAKGSSMSLKFPRKELVKFMISGGREHALVNIIISGGKGKKSEHWALVKDYQTDPLRSELLHVDFMEISLKQKIKTSTTIIISREPVGVKNGGILQQQLREVEIECLPTQIPAGIELDASAIDIGQSIHVSDLLTKEGVKILSDPHDVVLTVSAPVVEEVAPAEEEAAEPELVGGEKGKEEEGKEKEAEAAPAADEKKGQKEQKDKKEK